MRIGLAGAHRTGKTTLARTYSQDEDTTNVIVSATTAFKKYGLHPEDNLSFEDRLNVQWEILGSATDAWRMYPTEFITDRTPVDFMAYLLGDVSPSNLPTDREVAAIENYSKACFAASEEFFDVLMLVQPGIPIKHDPEKYTAAINNSYIEMLNAIMAGVFSDQRLCVPVYAIHRENTTLTGRVEAVKRCAIRVHRKYQAQVERVVYH